MALVIHETAAKGPYNEGLRSMAGAKLTDQASPVTTTNIQPGSVPLSTPTRLRVAAIGFLNPAPLLYDFEHEPQATRLRDRYSLHYTSPAQCAAQLSAGEADLGLIPIGALPTVPHLLAVPGCTIASLRAVRSIQLVVRPGATLDSIRTVAADNASRSSVAYLQVVLRAFYNNDPLFTQSPADLPAMLQASDAALLIGDPALLALEQRAAYPGHTWYDLATLWNEHTGLPWVAAVWAVDPKCLVDTTPTRLIEDLSGSRDAGLTHVETLVLEWAPRIAIPAATIRTYLSENIHYDLDPACLQAVARFYELAAQTGVLARYELPMLKT